MRLIDADLALEKIRVLEKEPNYQHEDEDWSVGLCMAEQAIDEVPTVDAVEVKYGEWLTPLYDEPWRKGYFCRCSVCNKINNGHTLSVPNFCENCGAKMATTKGVK